MSDTATNTDHRDERVAAATKEAGSASRHGAGMDGDDDSAADKNDAGSEPQKG